MGGFSRVQVLRAHNKTQARQPQWSRKGPNKTRWSHLGARIAKESEAGRRSIQGTGAASWILHDMYPPVTLD